MCRLQQRLLRKAVRGLKLLHVRAPRAQILGLLAFTSPEKILFGSDWPYAPLDFGIATTKQFDEFCENDPYGKQLAGVNSENARKLFGW